MTFKEFPARYALAILGMFGAFTKYMLKVNLNVAIVEMVTFDLSEVNSTSLTGEALNTSATSSATKTDLLLCADSRLNNEPISNNSTKFHWTATQQGLVLGSFSYGDIAAQVAMAYLSRRFGHVRVIGITVFSGGVMTILTPIITESFGIAGLVATRIAVGVLTGATTSLLVGLVASWSPPQERSRMMSIIFAGVPLGFIVIMPAAGVLAATSGWKVVFHVTGVCGAFWAVLWMFLAHETPSDHPRISDHEKEFITSSLNKNISDKESRKVPWGNILRSAPVRCIIIANVCSLYGYQTLSTLFPTYLKVVQKLDTETSGIIGAVPFAVNGCFGLLSGIVADCFISKGLRVIAVRKAFTAIGMTISAIAVVCLGYTGCNLIAATTMATLVVTMDAFTIPGFKACTLDIAPRLSGVIFSMSETLGLATGFIAPQVTGALWEAYGFFGWQISFWIAASLYLVGMGQFVIFGKNEKQAWARDKKKRQISVVTVQETIEWDPSVEEKANPVSGFSFSEDILCKQGTLETGA